MTKAVGERLVRNREARFPRIAPTSRRLAPTTVRVTKVAIFMSSAGAQAHGNSVEGSRYQ
jgi:hypothetical protein